MAGKLGRCRSVAAVMLSAGVGTMALAPSAFAGTSSNGTATANVLGGSLGVTVSGSMTALAPSIGGTANGALPAASWQDETGLGLGWGGWVAVSPLTFTGSWAASSGSTALASSGAGSFTGTTDGVYYTVTVTTTGLGAALAYSWTSNAAGDTGGGSGTAVAGSANIGTHGISIAFNPTGTYTAGNSYTVLAGTQSVSALAVHTATEATIVSNGTSSPPPSYINNGTTITAGAGVGTEGAAIQVLEAAVGQGASGTGSYSAAPGVTISADSNSWAATYTGNLTYSIVAGP